MSLEEQHLLNKAAAEQGCAAKGSSPDEKPWPYQADPRGRRPTQCRHHAC
jgi:hypothetical protein